MTLTVMVWDKQRQTGELQGLEAHKPTPSWRDSGGGAGTEVGNLGLVWDLTTEKNIPFAFNYHGLHRYQRPDPMLGDVQAQSDDIFTTIPRDRFLLYCLVIQGCPTICDPVDCSLLRSSIHGTSHTRILGWLPFPSPETDILKIKFRKEAEQAITWSWWTWDGNHVHGPRLAAFPKCFSKPPVSLVIAATTASV